jgi:hypothetical protein
VGSASQRGQRANGRSALTERAHQAARENGRALEVTGTVNPAPPGSGREGACARKRAIADMWEPPVRRRGRARARPGWAGFGLMG